MFVYFIVTRIAEAEKITTPPSIARAAIVIRRDAIHYHDSWNSGIESDSMMDFHDLGRSDFEDDAYWHMIVVSL